MISYIIISILLIALILISIKFHKYKKIANAEFEFYENKLEEEESSKKEIIAEYDSKKHLLENPHPEDFNVENKDIKQDLDQRTDKIYDYLVKISNQIDHLHYHQLHIAQIESKRSKSQILTLQEHHNYIEYILQIHNAKSKIDYFSYSLIATEIKILPFTFFVLRPDKNIIIDTKLLQFIWEFQQNKKQKTNQEAEDILTDRINKYFNIIANEKYEKNIQSYFVDKSLTMSDKENIIIAIVPTANNLSLINNLILDDEEKKYHLIDSSELYKFL
jgi:hypothetical protein